MGHLLVPFLTLVCFSYLPYIAADITEYEINQMCHEKPMEIFAYPGEPGKFIVCMHDKNYVGLCPELPNPDTQGPPLQTCFSESKRTCSLDHCDEDDPQTDYYDFVKLFCNNDNNRFVRLPAEDCEHFYVCLGSNNKPIYESCPAGQHFSRVQNTCVPAVAANCQTLDSMCANKRTGYLFAGSNCYEYYECVESNPVMHSCSYNEHFDSVNKKCIPANQSKCHDGINRFPECTTADNGLYFAHPQCNKFYVCVNSVAIEAKCQPDYYFDAKSQTCNKDYTGSCRRS